MVALAQDRPVFHSEADFQFSFAQVLESLAPGVSCRLEKPIANPDTGRTEYLDLNCIGPSHATPIEFKYFTRKWSGSVGDEDYLLRAHAATDLLRLHFVHDLVRLERVCTTMSGVAILLTNEPGLWSPATTESRDSDFRLHEGRVLGGELLWAKGAFPKNSRVLAGTYTLGWQPYSYLDGSRGGQFQYLAVEISPLKLRCS